MNSISYNLDIASDFCKLGLINRSIKEAKKCVFELEKQGKDGFGILEHAKDFIYGAAAFLNYDEFDRAKEYILTGLALLSKIV